MSLEKRIEELEKRTGAGKHITFLNNQPNKRHKLETKLKNAGCNTDTSGADWLDAGDFS